jgi:hypothetical protein
MDSLGIPLVPLGSSAETVGLRACKNHPRSIAHSTLSLLGSSLLDIIRSSSRGLDHLEFSGGDQFSLFDNFTLAFSCGDQFSVFNISLKQNFQAASLLSAFRKTVKVLHMSALVGARPARISELRSVLLTGGAPRGRPERCRKYSKIVCLQLVPPTLPLPSAIPDPVGLCGQRFFCGLSVGFLKAVQPLWANCVAAAGTASSVSSLWGL